jgi:hypothetical protein
MIMDSRIAAELLYESEATLRMVDTALDELAAGDPGNELRIPGVLLESFGTDLSEESEFEMPSELCIRAYWQVQEVADCVRESRELLRTVRVPADRVAAPVDERARFDRVLSLIDRLDSGSNAGSTSTDAALFGELRAEIMAVIGHAEESDQAARNVSLAISFLSEAEGRLTRLGNVFDSHD